MLTEENIFPSQPPHGYQYLPDEPVFDPRSDLCLERPQEVKTLADLGYGPDFAARYPSGLAITSPLRLLSDAGTRKLRTVVKLLEKYAIWGTSESAPGIVRGAAYRSKFIRDFSLSVEVSEFLGEIVGSGLRPTAMGHQLAHINLPPRDGSGLVGNWHIDENSYVVVLGLHDTGVLKGGAFQYFNGVRWRGFEELTQNSGQLPPGEVINVTLPGAGWGLLMQGSAVLHRAEPLDAPGDRVTVVTSYEPVDCRFPDQNPPWMVETGYANDENGALEQAARSVEFARHKAWRARGQLDDFIRELPWGVDEEEIVRRLTSCVRDVVEAANALRRGEISAHTAIQLHAAKEASFASGDSSGTQSQR